MSGSLRTALSNHEPSRRLVLRQAQDERWAEESIARQTSRWRPSSSDVNSPLILSRSKDERLAQDSPVEPRAIPAARPSTGSGRAMGRRINSPPDQSLAPIIVRCQLPAHPEPVEG